MGESKEKLIKAIKHYQDSLERHTKTGNSEKLLHGIEKLSKLPIKVCHLEETGVGRTVNGLKKFEGSVGDNARLLVDKWKSVVKGEEEEEARLQQERLAIENNKIDQSSHRKNGDRKHKISKSSDSESDHKAKRKRKESVSDSDDTSENSSPKTSTESDSESSEEDYRKHKSDDRKSHRKDEPRSSSSKCDKKDEITKHSSSSKRHQSNNSDREKQSSDKSKHRSSSDRNKSHTDGRSTIEKSASSSDKHTHKQSDHRKSSSSHSDRKKEESSKDESKKESKHNKEDKKRSESSRESKNHKTDEKITSSISSKGKGKKEVKHDESTRSDKRKSSKQVSREIDSGSGTSFADALGMIEPSVYPKNKKKSLPIEEKPSSSRGPSTSKEINPAENETSASKPCNLLEDPGKLEPLDINISSLLPSITPNYKPIGFTFEEHNRKTISDDEALTRVITAKHQRTKVYSGNKSGYTKVPSLFEICSRILQENLDALEYTGGVPYLVLKSILERANPNQLYQLEFHNPYLIEDTDELWQLHCQRDFRNKKREEMESWREMYMRCLDEREAKLKALTANIKQSQVKSIPVRQTKLAYVDSVVKPPRNVLKKQARNGTGADLKRPTVLPKERAIELAKAGEAGKVSVPNPGRSAVERGPNSHHSSSNLKPKKAPLMAKTLSLLKNRFGRR